MTPDALLARVTGMIQGENLILDPSVFPDSRIARLCDEFIGPDLRTMENANVRRVGDDVVVTATPSAPDEPGSQSVPVEARFSIRDGEPDLVYEVRLPAGWSLLGEYPQLSGQADTDFLAPTRRVPFEDVSFQDPSYIFVSNPDGDPEQHLQRGRNLAGSLVLEGFLAPLGWMFAGGSPRLVGPITPSKQGPILSLIGRDRLADQGNWLPPVDTELGLSTSVPAGATPGAAGAELESALEVAITMEIEAVAGAVPVRLSTTLEPGEDLLFVSAEVPGHALAGFDSLGALALHRDLGALVPPGVHDGDGINLAAIVMCIGLARRELISTSVALSIPTDWTIAEGLTISEVDLVVVIDDPAQVRDPIRCGVEGQLSIGDARFTVGATSPDFEVFLHMDEAHSVSLTAAVDRFAPAGYALPPGLRDFSLSGLDVRLATSPAALSFRAAVASDWSIAGSVTLEEVGVEIDYSSGAGVDLSVDCAFQLTDDIRLTLAGSADSDGCALSGQWLAEEGAPHRMADLVPGLQQTFPGFAVPAAVADAAVERLDLSFDTSTNRFTLGFSGSLDEIMLELSVDLTRNDAGGYDKHVEGHLTIADLHFDALFDQDADREAFVAAYSNAAGGSVSLGDLVRAAGGESPDADEVSFKLKDAVAVFVRGESKSFLLALDMDVGIDLSSLGSLPILDRALPVDQALRLAFEPVVSSDPAPGPGAYADLLPPGAPVVPPGLRSPFDFVARVSLGAETLSFQLGGAATPTSAANLQPELGSPQVGAPAAGARAPRASLMEEPRDITWMEIGKHVGPLDLSRLGIGIDIKENSIHALLDAAVAAGPLTLALDGLGATYDIDARHLFFSLDGLSLSLATESVTVSGALLHVEEDFVGQATLRFGETTISALGAYGSLGGHPSLFVYALVDTPVGGPPCFSVEGFAVGVGYNRALLVPDIADIASFPLVAEASGDAEPPVGGGDPAAALRAEMAALEQYLPPQADQYFLAAGIKFNSFRLIDGFALLVVSFGRHTEVDVIGTATLRIPALPPDPGGGGEAHPPPKPALAEIEIELAARYLVAEGFLRVQAQLTSRSYAISRDCHVVGGFAYFSWFAGEHAGDFVASLGGYHPRFRVPEHYPAVPRVGFSWRVDPHTAIKGDAYFAMTPAVAMAGAHLEAAHSAGTVEAWFKMGIDILVQWEPFHYTAGASVELGARVTIDPLDIGTIRVTIEALAAVELWGPEFAGRAHIEARVLGVKIAIAAHFGAAGATPPPALTWGAFSRSFLPAPEAVCGVSVDGGLLRTTTVEDGGGTSEIHVVNAKELLVSTSSAIPSHALTGRAGDAPLVRAPVAAAEIGVAPMAVAPAYFDAGPTGASGRAEPTLIRQEVEITRDDVDVTSEFACEAIVSSFPAALWGATADPEKALNEGVIDLVSGFRLRPASAPVPGASARVERRQLAYDVDALAVAPEPGGPGGVVTYSVSGRDRDLLAGRLEATRGRRAAVLRALGLADEPWSDLDAELAAMYVVAPLSVSGASGRAGA